MHNTPNLMKDAFVLFAFTPRISDDLSCSFTVLLSGYPRDEIFVNVHLISSIFRDDFIFASE